MAIRDRKSAVPSIADRNAALDGELADLIARLEKLRAAWDRFLRGQDRIPPLTDRDQLARELRNSRLAATHKTNLKFRFANLQQRFTTYNTYWERCMRMIEEGTFKREKGGMGRALAVQGQQRQASKEPMRRLYEDWQKAGREAGSSKAMDFDGFRRRMQNQRLKHIEKFACDDVEYSVRVKDGKVALVAKPIRD